MKTPPSTTRALILGAGPQMQCGVGQFTLRLAEALEKREPGSTAALTLSQTQGSPAGIWRAVGSSMALPMFAEPVVIENVTTRSTEHHAALEPTTVIAKWDYASDGRDHVTVVRMLTAWPRRFWAFA